MVAAEPVAGPVTFTYRADGRRVRKERPAGVRRFRYDLERLLEELDDGGELEQQYTSTLEEWGELISEYDGAETLYRQYDALGTTDALLDEDEAVTDRYAHRAFGAAASHAGTSATPLTFVAAQHDYRDAELDLYLAGARHYDPAAGRWLSEDPIRLAGNDHNLYRYVRNNPVNDVDPSGERVDPDFDEERGLIIWRVYSDAPQEGHRVGGRFRGTKTIPAGTLLGTVTVNQRSFFRGNRETPPATTSYRTTYPPRLEEMKALAQTEAKNRNQNQRVFYSVEYWYEEDRRPARPRDPRIMATYESPAEMGPERKQHFEIQNGYPPEARAVQSAPAAAEPDTAAYHREPPRMRPTDQAMEWIDSLGVPLTPGAAHHQINPNETRSRQIIAERMIAACYDELADQLESIIFSLGLAGLGLGVGAALQIRVVRNGMMHIRSAGGKVWRLSKATVDRIRRRLTRAKGRGTVTDDELIDAVRGAIETRASTAAPHSARAAAAGSGGAGPYAPVRGWKSSQTGHTGSSAAN